MSTRGNAHDNSCPVPDRAAGRSLFSTAFGAARNAMVVIGEDRRFLHLNDAALVALGYRRDELVGRKFDEVVAASDRESVDRAWTELMKRGTCSGETRVLSYDGSFSAVGYEGSLIVTERGRVALVAADAGPSVPAPGEEGAGQQALSKREREVVRMLAEGKTGVEVADELFISVLTVQTHVRNAMRKLGAQTRAHLIAVVVRGGLL